MIAVVGIRTLDRVTADDAIHYEVTVVHRGNERKFIFRVNCTVIDDFPITAYMAPREAYMEFADYDLNNPPPRGRPCGGPNNPVVDDILEIVKKFSRGEKVQLPSTISVVKARWKRFWHRWKDFGLFR